LALKSARLLCETAGLSKWKFRLKGVEIGYEIAKLSLVTADLHRTRGNGVIEFGLL
jgi:hypothetical protein